MGGIIFDPHVFADSLSETVGYKAGLALSLDELCEHLSGTQYPDIIRAAPYRRRASSSGSSSALRPRAAAGDPRSACPAPPVTGVADSPFRWSRNPGPVTCRRTHPRAGTVFPGPVTLEIPMIQNTTLLRLLIPNQLSNVAYETLEHLHSQRVSR